MVLLMIKATLMLDQFHSDILPHIHDVIDVKVGHCSYR